MSCLSNAPVQHSQPASVIKTDNDPNSATSLIFQLKPAAWFQPQTKRLVAGGEMEACHTVFLLLFFYYYSAVLYFSLCAEQWFRSKASISLLLSFFSAMFWLHKSIYDDLSRRRKERRTFSPEKLIEYLHFELWSRNLREYLRNKLAPVEGRFPPRCCVGYGWVLFNLFWDLKN